MNTKRIKLRCYKNGSNESLRKNNWMIFLRNWPEKCRVHFQFEILFPIYDDQRCLLYATLEIGWLEEENTFPEHVCVSGKVTSKLKMWKCDFCSKRLNRRESSKRKTLTIWTLAHSLNVHIVKMGVNQITAFGNGEHMKPLHCVNGCGDASDSRVSNIYDILRPNV